MILIADSDFWTIILMTGICGLWTMVTLTTCRRYIFARIKELLGWKRILKVGKDGIVRWSNSKIDCGFLVEKDSMTQIAASRIVRTNEGDFYILTEGFGLSYDLNIAAATTMLSDLGFRNIVQALQAYDSAYFSIEANKKKLEEAIKLDNDLNQQGVRIKGLIEDSRTKLLNLDLEWLSPYTVPLAVTYQWALQNTDSINMKNIYEKGILAARNEELHQGWTQEKIQGFAIIALSMVIVASLGFYIVNLATPAAPQVLPGTTTLIENMTNVTTTLVTNIK